MENTFVKIVYITDYGKKSKVLVKPMNYGKVFRIKLSRVQGENLQKGDILDVHYYYTQTAGNINVKKAIKVSDDIPFIEYISNEFNNGETIDTKKIISSISKNWKLEAKYEKNKNYFFYNTEVNSVLENDKYYVIGRKGTGKTSISEYLLNLNEYNIFTEKLSFKHFPFNKLYKHNNENFSTHNQYITIWKYIIYSSVAKLMTVNEKIDANVRKELKKIYRPDPIKSLQSTIDNWTATDVEFDVFGIGGKIRVEKDNNKNSLSWIDRVNSLEQIIEKYNNNSTYYIVFDELDDDYKENTGNSHKQYLNLLTGLFKAVQDIISINDNIKPIVFLRNDIYDILDDNDKSKWEDLEVNIKWNENKIKKMLTHRISIDANLKKEINFDIAWFLVFGKNGIMYQNRKINIFEYLNKKTQLRPRDYIRFIKKCALDATENQEPTISFVNIKNKLNSYSSSLKNEIKDEALLVIPEFEKYLKLIRSIGKTVFLYDDFIKAFNTFSKQNNLVQNDQNFILNKLFYFSVIGYIDSNTKEHIFKFSHPNEYFLFDEKIIVFEGLHKVLHLDTTKPIPIEKDNIQTKLNL